MPDKKKAADAMEGTNDKLATMPPANENAAATTTRKAASVKKSTLGDVRCGPGKFNTFFNLHPKATFIWYGTGTYIGECYRSILLEHFL